MRSVKTLGLPPLYTQPCINCAPARRQKTAFLLSVELGGRAAHFYTVEDADPADNRTVVFV